MATKAARGGRGGGDDGAVRGGRRGRGRGGGGDGSPGGRDGFGRSAAASSEEPRGRVASAPAFVEDANVSPVGKLLRRASVFVRGVMTANPFMRRALAPTQTRGAYYAARSRRDRTANRTMGTSSEDSVALVAESSDAHVSGSGGPAPQEATMASPPRSKTSRPSSWRRRKDAKAREATAKASEREVTDSPNDSNDVRATHDAASAAMWDEIGHAAAARPDEEDARETAVEETPPRPPSSSPNQTPRARAPTTPGARTPATRSTPGSPSSRRASDARRATGKEPRPGSVVFDASAFMHKSSYPRLPGLPRRHALNASGTGPAAARRLYRLIFVPPKARAKDKNESARASVAAAGVGGGGAGGFAFPGTSGSVHAVGPRGAYAAWTTPAKQHNARRVRRIARRDREALLPLLSAMLRRASKRPYGALLDLHCPTPSWLSRRGEPATPRTKKPPPTRPGHSSRRSPPRRRWRRFCGPPRRASSRERCSADRARARRYARFFFASWSCVGSNSVPYTRRWWAFASENSRGFAGNEASGSTTTRGVARAAAGPSPRPRRAARNSAGGSDGSSPSSPSRCFARIFTAPRRSRIAFACFITARGVGATHRRAPRGDDGRPRGRDARESRRRGRPSRRGRSRGRHRRHRGVSAHAATPRQAFAPAPPPRIRETATPAKGDGSASRRHARPPRGGVLPNPPRLERRKRAGGRRRTMEGEDWRSGTTRRARVSSGEHQPSRGVRRPQARGGREAGRDGRQRQRLPRRAQTTRAFHPTMARDAATRTTRAARRPRRGGRRGGRSRFAAAADDARPSPRPRLRPRSSSPPTSRARSTASLCARWNAW